MKPDAHNFKRRLELILKGIEVDQSISEKNKKTMVSFHSHLYALGLGTPRVMRYIYDVKILNKMLGKDFDQATKDDIERVMADLERTNYAENTKHGFRISVRKFYQWLRGTEELPPEVKWIKVKNPKDRIRLPEDMLTEEEILRLIDAANTTRNKAFISVLYESGCRIGEMLSMQVKNMTFDEYGAQLLVEGKTGFRRVRVVTSVPYLTQWLNTHPQKNDPEAPLWIATGKTKTGNYFSYSHMLIVTAKRAGILKAVNPHNFRHSRATHLANHLTEAQMKEHFGWTQGSDMASIYVHLSGRDVDKAILKTHGIKMEEDREEKSLLLPKQCKRCKDVNPATNKFCRVCGLPLSDKIADEIVVNELKRRQADEVMDALIKDDEFRHILIEKILKADSV